MQSEIEMPGLYCETLSFDARLKNLSSEKGFLNLTAQKVKFSDVDEVLKFVEWMKIHSKQFNRLSLRDCGICEHDSIRQAYGLDLGEGSLGTLTTTEIATMVGHVKPVNKSETKAGRLGEIFKQKTDWLSIDLTHNNLNAIETCVLLKAILGSQTKLRSLNLTLNHVDQNSLTALSKYLNETTTLRYLILNSCLLSLKKSRCDLKSFLTDLKGNRSLRELDLSGCALSDDEFALLFTALEGSESIVRVKFDTRLISRENLLKLEQKLETNREAQKERCEKLLKPETLNDLMLYSIDIDDADAVEILLGVNQKAGEEAAKYNRLNSQISLELNRNELALAIAEQQNNILARVIRTSPTPKANTTQVDFNHNLQSIQSAWEQHFLQNLSELERSQSSSALELYRVQVINLIKKEFSLTINDNTNYEELKSQREKLIGELKAKILELKNAQIKLKSSHDNYLRQRQHLLRLLDTTNTMGNLVEQEREEIAEHLIEVNMKPSDCEYENKADEKFKAQTLPNDRLKYKSFLFRAFTLNKLNTFALMLQKGGDIFECNADATPSVFDVLIKQFINIPTYTNAMLHIRNILATGTEKLTKHEQDIISPYIPVLNRYLEAIIRGKIRPKVAARISGPSLSTERELRLFPPANVPAITQNPSDELFKALKEMIILLQKANNNSLTYGQKSEAGTEISAEVQEYSSSINLEALTNLSEVANPIPATEHAQFRFQLSKEPKDIDLTPFTQESSSAGSWTAWFWQGSREAASSLSSPLTAEDKTPVLILGSQQ